MDLAFEDPRRIATLILNGSLQINEVPEANRHKVVSIIDVMEREAAEKKAKAKKAKKPAVEKEAQSASKE